MERAVERAGPIDAAVVGEPTNLDIATAQRGLMMVDLVARGDQRHAGYAAADGEFVNAVAGARARSAPAGGAVQTGAPIRCWAAPPPRRRCSMPG